MNILFYKRNRPSLHQFLRHHITTTDATDKYPVKNTHPIIRAKTSDGDTKAILQKRTKAVFQSKQSQHNFHSHFTPSIHYTFSQDQLEHLKVTCAEPLVSIFSHVATLTPVILMIHLLTQPLTAFIKTRIASHLATTQTIHPTHFYALTCLVPPSWIQTSCGASRWMFRFLSSLVPQRSYLLLNML